MRKLRKNDYVNNRRYVGLCPFCDSKVVITSTGEICTGESKLKLLDVIKSYKEAVDKDKFLENISDIEKFLEYVNFGIPECPSRGLLDFSRTKQYITDPIAVKQLERRLNRKLKEEELEPGNVFVVNGQNYVLPLVEFPYDF